MKYMLTTINTHW